MAEAVVLNLARLLDDFSKDGRLRGFVGDTTELKKTLSFLQIMARDADNRSFGNDTITPWLYRLRDACYDAEDLLEGWKIAVMRRESLSKYEKLKLLFTSFSPSNRLALRLNDIGKIIEGIAAAGRDLGLRECVEDVQFERRSRDDERSDSLVYGEEIVGRESDKSAIMEFLLDSNTDERFSVLSIWGKSGIGKTALARCLYNDDIVKRHFDLRMWVCVGRDDFRDLERELRKIRRADDMEQSRRYLLVIDDVIDKSAVTKQWGSLKNLLMGGAQGSKVLFTTSSKSVADNVGTAPSYYLDALSQESPLATVEHVIGIDDRVKDLIKLLDIGNMNVGVRMVGICGVDGIGKTTIAKAVYERLSSYFDSCSFLAEIGDKAKDDDGIQSLQTKLVSDILKRAVDVPSLTAGIKFFPDIFRCIKALIVLDDVEQQSHLSNFVGDQLEWFGSGSRIIVLSENPGILQKYVSQGVAHIYEVTEMDDDRALKLLCKHASTTDDFILDYPEIVNNIVKATGQVPYAIEVMGSFIRGKTIEDWRKMEGLIKQWKQNSREIPKDCREIFKFFYEALDEKQKEIFWDIAWFANGVDGRIASYMWPHQNLLPPHHVLMPLAKIGQDNMLRTHRLLKHLSQTIDKEKYSGRRSKLCMHVLDLEVIDRKEGTEEVEVVLFDLKNDRPHTVTGTYFKSMPNIRFLQLDRAIVSGNFANVFPKLRWLRWQGCPRDFEATDFDLTKVAILDLSWSKINEEWSGWRKIKMEQLKVLNLTGCADLLMSPTFASFPNLEILVLERCSRLVHLDNSVGGLKRLLCLNLRSCTELPMLPAQLVGLEALKELLIDKTSVQDIPLEGNLKKLETLSASNCSSLSLLPRSFEHLKSLSTLLLDNSKITKVPDGVGALVKLRRLSLRKCRCIRELPESIGQLGSSLEELDVSRTGALKLPDSFGNLLRLRVLKMEYCFITEFPSFIGRLHSLEEIHASFCRNLEGEIPRDIGKLVNLRVLRLRCSGVSSLPSEIEHLSKLETLDLLQCDMLQDLPALPPGVVNVRLSPKLKEKMSRH